MAERIEDYALLGDLQTAALVGRTGSIDWLCFPRFDSAACFAALLGTHDHGRWLLAPVAGGVCERRRYREDTLILEQEWQTETGRVRVIDFMPPRETKPDIVRIAEGVEGHVEMRTEITIRFDYGAIVPWVRRVDGARIAIGGPDALVLRTPVELRGENFATVGDFTIGKGERVPFTLTWFPSNEPAPDSVDPEGALRDTEQFWLDWLSGCRYEGQWRDAVHRSLLVLKALTYAPTGGIIAAPTTSLPERIGGVRNWDYRYGWLRDATFTLYALLNAGFDDEARAWRDWLLRAVAGEASKLQIMYGVAGERRLTEYEVEWLPGYAGSAPVRVGNAASEQLQLDVYGEVLDALHQARRAGLAPDHEAWSLERKLVEFLESTWQNADAGIWEVRGPNRHFTHSKVLAWVAFDRAIAAAEALDDRAPLERWKQLRQEVHEEVCREGFNVELNSFVQSYGTDALDASTLLIPLVGFLPVDDERVVGTIDRIQRDLTRDGFVDRYAGANGREVDGLPPGEGVFLPCSFWLVDCLQMLGRHDEATALFERLLALRNDVGLLAEEYDPSAKRLLGNFPQAFSHVGLVNSAYNLGEEHGPTAQRPTVT